VQALKDLPKFNRRYPTKAVRRYATKALMYGIGMK
jgi:hypothetical protein